MKPLVVSFSDGEVDGHAECSLTHEGYGQEVHAHGLRHLHLLLPRSGRLPRKHFTMGLCAHNPNYVKTCVALLWNMIVRSGHNCAHVMPTELRFILWVRNCFVKWVSDWRSHVPVLSCHLWTCVLGHSDHWLIKQLHDLKLQYWNGTILLGMLMG